MVRRGDNNSTASGKLLRKRGLQHCNSLVTMSQPERNKRRNRKVIHKFAEIEDIGLEEPRVQRVQFSTIPEICLIPGRKSPEYQIAKMHDDLDVVQFEIENAKVAPRPTKRFILFRRQAF
uniref:Uncharacterized protein n=1 Tax=Timspurckia oligopyrenoides TaxID=708627 RepID=A0A7S0ZJ71_9RHOD|mmetsp:Transcript_7272/g.13126  ORF Transcript_7272/g.13126 Transcript_7272/m.13126 type:complete len:120 (+) Transcript_7272:290-649(+)